MKKKQLTKDTVAVLGAGAWGTALALTLARNEHPTWLWAYNTSHVQSMREQRCNARYFPHIVFPELLMVSATLTEVLSRARDVIIALPSVVFGDVMRQIQENRPEHPLHVCCATKGLDPQSGQLLHTVAQDIMGHDCPYAVLSGPSFALEVANGLPTAIVVSSRAIDFAKRMCDRLHSASLRVYTNTDIIGTQLGGAVKNVLAIGAGIADGLRLGANARAALITRGLVEMMRLGEAMGAHRDTFMGLSGLGDLVLTCTDDQSRNRRLGLALGQGVALESARATIAQVVEGINTCAQVIRLAQQYHVDMPIARQVHQVLHAQKPIQQAFDDLFCQRLAGAE